VTVRFNNNNNNNNKLDALFILRAELNSQWPVSEPAQIQTAAARQQDKKQQKKQQQKMKNGSTKAFYIQA
jgi:hypothetical protein